MTRLLPAASLPPAHRTSSWTSKNTEIILCNQAITQLLKRDPSSVLFTTLPFRQLKPYLEDAPNLVGPNGASWPETVSVPQSLPIQEWMETKQQNEWMVVIVVERLQLDKRRCADLDLRHWIRLSLTVWKNGTRRRGQRSRLHDLMVTPVYCTVLVIFTTVRPISIETRQSDLCFSCTWPRLGFMYGTL